VEISFEEGAVKKSPAAPSESKGEGGGGGGGQHKKKNDFLNASESSFLSQKAGRIHFRSEKEEGKGEESLSFSRTNWGVGGKRASVRSKDRSMPGERKRRKKRRLFEIRGGKKVKKIIGSICSKREEPS